MAYDLLQTSAQRLVAAIADYDAALDRGAVMSELRLFDREVARAERAHLAAGGKRERSDVEKPETIEGPVPPEVAPSSPPFRPPV